MQLSTLTSWPSLCFLRFLKIADLLAYCEIVASDDCGAAFTRVYNTPKRWSLLRVGCDCVR